MAKNVHIIPNVFEFSHVFRLLPNLQGHLKFFCGARGQIPHAWTCLTLSSHMSFDSAQLFTHSSQRTFDSSPLLGGFKTILGAFHLYLGAITKYLGATKPNLGAMDPNLGKYYDDLGAIITFLGTHQNTSGRIPPRFWRKVSKHRSNQG